MIIKLILLFIVTAISAYTDAKENKIKNKLLLPILILGILSSVITGGFNGLLDSIIGIVLPFFALYILYALNMFGAGDVKLFCTIGAIMGYKFVINNFIYSILVGGIVAVFVLIFSKKFITNMKNFFIYIGSIFLTKNIVAYGENDSSRKLPFAIIIFIGTILQLVIRFKFI